METNSVDEEFKELKKEIDNLKQEVESLHAIIDILCAMWDTKLDFFEEKIKIDKKMQDNLYEYLNKVDAHLSCTDNKLNKRIETCNMNAEVSIKAGSIKVGNYKTKHKTIVFKNLKKLYNQIILILKKILYEQK